MTSSANANDPKALAAAAYDAVAEEYAALEVKEWPRLRRLRELLAALPPGSSVLDLGCGSAPAGPDVVRRHRLTGVDISRRQIALTRRHVAQATFLVADLASVEFEPSSFDAVVSFYAFDAVPRTEWAPLLRRIRDWLRPGGHLLLSAEDVDEDARYGTWLGVPSFLSSFDAAGTTRVVAEQAFEIVSVEVEGQEEMYGPDEPAIVRFTWVWARKGAYGVRGE